MDQMASGLTEDDLCKRSFVMAIRDSLNVVSGKWKLAIVCTLLAGPRGFSEIEKLLDGLAARMLSRELRELELNGVVEKVAVGEGARAQKYALTPSGQALEPLIVMMANWGQQHRALQQDQSGAG